MDKTAIVDAFIALPVKERAVLLTELALNTPNIMNSSDHHIACSTTYLANMLNEYHRQVEKGHITPNKEGTQVFKFIRENF